MKGWEKTPCERKNQKTHHPYNCKDELHIHIQPAQQLYTNIRFKTWAKTQHTLQKGIKKVTFLEELYFYTKLKNFQWYPFH